MNKKILILCSALLFLANLSYAQKKKHKPHKSEVKTSSSAVKIARPRRQKENLRAGKNFWDIRLSTTEVASIRQKAQAMPGIRGIHITSWVAGNEKLRKQLLEKISSSVINAVAVAIKEKDGKVYIPGIEKARQWGAYEGAIQNPEKMMEDFKKQKLYTIARIVCFHDKVVPVKNPAIAVKRPDGQPWRDRKGDTWVDPYDRGAWDYILDVSERAAQLGFNEIQFDYVRYPTEGDTKSCRFSQIHNRESATKNIAAFFQYARKRLFKYNVKISADVFGLSTGNDMGIGQDLNLIAENVDYVYPMMYPSHYYSGEYNITNPDSQPYKVLDRGLKQALNKTGYNYPKIRPYLQDFSLKWKYGPNELRAQIIAARANMVDSWILWNPAVKYSWDALTPQMYRAFIDPDWK